MCNLASYPFPNRNYERSMDTVYALTLQLTYGNPNFHQSHILQTKLQC